MDPISRDNNSMLPLGGIIVGAVALLLAGYSAIGLSKVKGTLATHEDKISKIDDLSTQVGAAATKTEVNAALKQMADNVTVAFKQTSDEIGTLKAELAKAQEAKKAPSTAKGGAKENVTAGPGEYVVKSGDTGSKIARAVGCTLGELEAVNPGVDWKALKVNQKLKLPSNAKQ
jgi:LysM repeat protein